jgi:predicted phosphodiesterase
LTFPRASTPTSFARRGLRVAPALGASLLLVLPTAALADGFRKGPYLQNVSTTAITVMFEIEAPTEATVHFGATRDYGRNAASGRKRLHEVRLDGLEPSTLYHYQVEAGGARSADRRFTTAATPGESFRFLVYGDNRDGHEAHARVVSAMRAEDADFVVNTGDMVADGGDPRDWQVFFDVERRLLAETTMFPVIGNHEIMGLRGRGLFRRWFSLPEDSLYPEQDYAFTFGSARFFVVTAYEGFPPEQIDWLRGELDEAEADPALEHRFVFLHHGLYSSGYHGGNLAARSAGLPRVLREGAVDVVFSGHDHDYERGRTSGLNYVVSGGGGAPLYDVDTRRKGAEAFESTHHHVRVDVIGDSIELTAVRPDGSVIEQCGVRRAASPGWRCTTPAAPPAAQGNRGESVGPGPVGAGCSPAAYAAVLPLVVLALIGLYARVRRGQRAGA